MPKKTLVLMFAILLSLPSYASLAQETETTEKNTFNESISPRERMRAQKAEFEERNRQQPQERKELVMQKRCEVAQKRISTKAKQLENNYAMYQRVYGNMDSRLDRLVQRLDEAGLNTAKLKTELLTLESMIQKLYTDYNAFITSFKETETAACSKTKEDFKTQFKGVRAQADSIKKDRAAIKDFFLSNIKPELQALKAQLPDDKPSTETEESSEARIQTRIKTKMKADDSKPSGQEVEVEVETETENEVERD